MPQKIPLTKWRDNPKNGENIYAKDLYLEFIKNDLIIKGWLNLKTKDLNRYFSK